MRHALMLLLLDRGFFCQHLFYLLELEPELGVLSYLPSIHSIAFLPGEVGPGSPLSLYYQHEENKDQK